MEKLPFHENTSEAHFRNNPGFTKFQQLIDHPKFIENIRIAPFPKRGIDVDVILDLMIHDIDLVLAVVGEYPVSV